MRSDDDAGLADLDLPSLRTDGRPDDGADVLGGALFVASSAVTYVGLLDREQVGDTPAYERFGEAIRSGDVPNRDFYVEYPPGALPAFVVPTFGPGDDYALRFKLLALALGVAVIAWSRSRRSSTSWSATSRPRRLRWRLRSPSGRCSRLSSWCGSFPSFRSSAAAAG